MELVLATRNPDKIREIKKALEGLGLKILTFKDFSNFPRVKEEGSTLRENALQKARIVARATGKLSLADDSGLEVEWLEGAPGVFSSRFAGEGVSYEDNNQKLLSLLKGVSEDKRKATFRCIMAICNPRGKEMVVEGICRGKITTQPRGREGFGYDPIFQPEGLNKTFAELSLSEKNLISHRAKALHKAKEILEEMIQVEGRFLIGLTGNMGCGKSTVVDFFRKWGIEVIKADEVGHRILEREEIKKKVVEIFGEGVLTSQGKLSRERIRKRAFTDEGKLKKLNALLHPVIKEEVWKTLKDGDHKVAVIEAALIFEAGWDFFLDRTIVVHCSKDKQLERIRKNTTLTSEEIEGLLKAQLPQEEKIKRADFTIPNEKDLPELKIKAKEVLKKILREVDKEYDR